MDNKKPDFSNVAGGGSSTAKPSMARTYTVKKGDSLWKIAKQHYGDGAAWSRIHDANRDVIKDPDRIQPGWVLRIPE